VPLLWLWRDQSPGRAALLGFVFGIGFYGLLLEWTRYFGAVAIVPLVAAEAAFVALIGAIVAVFARRGMRSPWLTAAVWVVVEGLKDRFPLGGFTWGDLGVALHDIPAARAVASFGGVALVTFLIVACNAVLLDLVLGARASDRRGLVRATAALVLVVAVTFVCDVTRYEPEVTGRIRFALLQGNDQNRDLTVDEIANQYLTRRHLELADRLKGDYDLIVFPESALENDPEADPLLRQQLVDIAREHDATVLVNARHQAADGNLYNANLAYGPDGELQGVYAKQHLVPFGEYVPLRDQLSFIKELEQVPYDFEPGDRRRLFEAGGRRFGTVICFESAFGPLVRDFVKDGAEAIVVSTNNRSYRRSALSEQHVAFSQMRAAETGRPVLHAAISGITAVVDADGDVRDESELFVNKITTGSIATRSGETLYVRFGDWVLVLSAAACVAAAAVAAWRARRTATVESAPAEEARSG
jgi:apolipoprotein N-acyltransferase